MDTILTVRCDIAGCWGSAVAENDAENFSIFYAAYLNFFPYLS